MREHVAARALLKVAAASADEVGALFDELDVDLTGEIDYKVYLDFVIARENAKSAHSIRWFFRLLDLNGDGRLTPFTVSYFWRGLSEHPLMADMEPISEEVIWSEIFDMVGPDWTQLLKGLRIEGTLVMIGVLGGTKTELDLRGMMQRRQTLTAMTMRSQPLEKRIAIAKVFNDRLAPLFANGRLRRLRAGLSQVRSLPGAPARAAGKSDAAGPGPRRAPESVFPEPAGATGYPLPLPGPVRAALGGSGGVGLELHHTEPPPARLPARLPAQPATCCRCAWRYFAALVGLPRRCPRPLLQSYAPVALRLPRSKAGSCCARHRRAMRGRWPSR